MKFSEIAFKCLFAYRAKFLRVNLAADFSINVVGWICRKEKFWLWRQNFTNDEASLRSVVVQMRTHFKILISRGVRRSRPYLCGRIYARREFGCRLRAARVDSVRMYLPGAAIEILKFEARGTLNLIACKRRERVKFMSISYKIS